MLAGQEPPDEGAVEHAEGLRVVMFDQHRAHLDPGVSLRRTLAPFGDAIVFQVRSVHVVGWEAVTDAQAEVDRLYARWAELAAKARGAGPV